MMANATLIRGCNVVMRHSATPGKMARILPIVLMLVGFAGNPGAVSAGIKCWTNKDGVRECGDRMPPEYAQKGHEEISDSGIKVKVIERAKTAEELEEARRQAAERAESERKLRARASKQLAHDQVLLHTFTTEEDLLLARDGKLAVIESRIKLTQNRVAKMEANLEQLVNKAAKQERGGKPVNEDLRKRIANVEQQVRNHMAYIDARRQEQDEIRQRFADDLQRFQDLKSGKVKPGDLSDGPEPEADS